MNRSPSSGKSSSSSFHRKAASIPRNRYINNTETDKIGRERLRKFYERKHTDNQLQTLKNRIHKLTRDEQNAQRKMKQTQHFADFFMQARYKFDVDQQIKNDSRYQKYMEIQEKRDRLNQERQESLERKKEIRRSVLESNLKQGYMVKQNLRQGFNERDGRLNDEMNVKLAKINQIKEYHKRHSMSKVERQENRVQENKNRFEKMLNQDNSRASSNVKLMKKLQKREQAIMEKLKETLNLQNSMNFFSKIKSLI